MKLYLLMLSLLSLAALVRAETSAECSAKNEPLTEEQLAQFGYVKKNPYSSTNFKVAPRRPAPPFHDAFAVVDEKFEKLSLSNYKGKWLVLFFYPFDFTFVCPTEIVSFSESIDDFRSLNTEVVGVSTDSHHTHLAWIRTPREEGGLGTMKIPLIADISKQISQDYGVLITDPKDDMYGAAIRGLFIIDPKGIIRSIQINDDMVGRSVDETMRTLKALQFADSHPHQVCPANWKPGAKTITADQEKKMEFFSEIYGKQEL